MRKDAEPQKNKIRSTRLPLIGALAAFYFAAMSLPGVQAQEPKPLVSSTPTIYPPELILDQESRDFYEKYRAAEATRISNVATRIAEPTATLTPTLIATRAPTPLPGLWKTLAKITAYCLDGQTKLDTPVAKGVVATDPDHIPLGSLMRIGGIEGEFIAEDTGGKVIGLQVDMWMADCRAAIEWGVQYREIEITRWGYSK